MGWKLHGVVTEIEPGKLPDGTRFDNVYLSLGRETVGAFILGDEGPALPAVGEVVEYEVRPQIKAGNGVPRLSTRIVSQEPALQLAKQKTGS